MEVETHTHLLIFKVGVNTVRNRLLVGSGSVMCQLHLKVR
jgi:hypothetical protein